MRWKKGTRVVEQRQNERPEERPENSPARRQSRRMNMTPSGAKAKGRRLQQWVRDKILAKIPGIRAGDVVSTPMGVNGSDIQLSPHALDLLPIQTECKNNKKFAIYSIYEQAKTHGDHIPVVIIKADFKSPLAIVDADHYFDLWSRALTAEQKGKQK